MIEVSEGPLDDVTLTVLDVLLDGPGDERFATLVAALAWFLMEVFDPGTGFVFVGLVWLIAATEELVVQEWATFALGREANDGGGEDRCQ